MTLLVAYREDDWKNSCQPVTSIWDLQQRNISWNSLDFNGFVFRPYDQKLFFDIFKTENDGCKRIIGFRNCQHVHWVMTLVLSRFQQLALHSSLTTDADFQLFHRCHQHPGLVLQTLTVTGSMITTRHAELLVDGWTRHDDLQLQELTVDRCSFESIQAMAVLSGGVSKLSNLQRLRFNNCHCQNGEEGGGGGEAVFEFHPPLPCLQSLSIESHLFGWRQFEALASLLDAQTEDETSSNCPSKKVPCPLKSLSLTGGIWNRSPLLFQAYSHLVTSLGRNKSLERVQLAGCPGLPAGGSGIVGSRGSSSSSSSSSSSNNKHTNVSHS